MKFRCTIYDKNSSNKEMLYSFEYDIPVISEMNLSKKCIPTVIVKTIDFILDSPIPEQLDKYNFETLVFVAQCPGLMVEFDLKGEIK